MQFKYQLPSSRSPEKIIDDVELRNICQNTLQIPLRSQRVISCRSNFVRIELFVERGFPERPAGTKFFNDPRGHDSNQSSPPCHRVATLLNSYKDQVVTFISILQTNHRVRCKSEIIWGGISAKMGNFAGINIREIDLV